MSYSKEECIEALREAKEKLGKSPTMREYNKLDVYPSADTVVRKFSSWNKAKKAANLETYNLNTTIDPQPDNIKLPPEKKWDELTSYQRYYYRNRSEEKQRTRKRSNEIKSWFKEFKKQFSCEKCDEDHPACLDFHHLEDKEAGVTELVSRQKASKKRIKREVKKCKVLCANCHRKTHY